MGQAAINFSIGQLYTEHGRWLVFAGGLATATLCATGIWLFARRHRPAR